MKEEIINYENYRIDVDEFQWILIELREVDKPRNPKSAESWYEGKVSDVVHGYYTSIDRLIEKMIRLETLKGGTSYPLKEYLSLWKETAERVNKDIKELFVLAS